MFNILILFNNRGVSGVINEYLLYDWVCLYYGRNVGDLVRFVVLNF